MKMEADPSGRRQTDPRRQTDLNGYWQKRTRAMDSITDVLARSSEGESSETDRLFSLMYDDLRRLAGKFLRNEPARDRLSSSSLVHQAYVRMVDQSRVNWQGKTHFFAIGATVMRRILVDHARKTRANKRGGNWQRRELTDEVTFHLHRDDDVMALDDLLQTLEKLNPRQAKIVELRFFGGLTMREIAAEVNLGLRTIEKEWAMARAWMRRELRQGLPEDEADAAGSSTEDTPPVDA
ncbi:RNA polymerase sigma factor [Crateriforma conspicua]|uniref:RNA polymerase sigma factor n=2 Tax=Planctomycetaceae TaxID=126 RepID=A0A5C5Y081_9PLAN|nr:RNA polymerase sigma factor [Crateriforma conspicua]